MTAVDVIAVARMGIYGGMAGYCALHRRWTAWVVFCALILSTYVYGFTDVSRVAVEVLRTIVAGGLVYITLRRK